MRIHTHTHTHIGGKRKETDYGGTGEGVTNHAASEPFGMFCHHMVTKRAGMTKHAGNASTDMFCHLGHFGDKTCHSDKTCCNNPPSPPIYTTHTPLASIVYIYIYIYICKLLLTTHFIDQGDDSLYNLYNQL